MKHEPIATDEFGYLEIIPYAKYYVSRIQKNFNQYNNEIGNKKQNSANQTNKK